MSNIRKEQIIQLRQHDLDRGRNRSEEPVYPITILAAIKDADKLSGTEVVDNLPQEGEIGKIYYSREDGSYYYYNGDDFVKFLDYGDYPELVDKSLKIKYITSPASYLSGQDSGKLYSVYDDMYNILGTVGGANGVLVGIAFHDTVAEDAVHSIVGRFTVDAEDTAGITLVLPSGVHVPDDCDVEYTAGHSYEFNILHDTYMVTDITYTDNSNS